MYLIPSNVIAYVDGERTLVTTDWKRSLVLLRDSLRERYGPLVLMAPSLPANLAQAQSLEEVSQSDCGIVVRPAFDARCRARHYWVRERKRWRGQIASALKIAQVVHAGLDDVYRPIAFDACLEAFRARKPVVFVQDTDIVRQRRELAAGRGWPEQVRARCYGFAFDRCMKYGIRRAALSLMKGRLLSDRYRPFALHMKEFEDTSYTTSEIVPRASIESRLTTLDSGRSLRFVYCGRIESRKGVAHSVRAIAGALRQGARVSFDIIGDGSARTEAETLAREHGIADHVRFLGRRSYGPELLRELASYDALLFTPLAEDTPRMIFDAYAAGLPMIGYGIEYVKERADREGATIVMTPNDPEGAGVVLAEVERDRARLRTLTAKAMDAALYHAAEVWYARRAEWTFEAVDRYQREQSRRAAL